MGYDTVALGLTLKVPTVGTKNYAKTFLDDFAKKISAHDHTGGGRGLQLGTSSLGNAIITQAKLANLSVGTAQIIAKAVTDAKFADFGNGTGYTPTILSANVSSGTPTTGRYWAFGPFIFFIAAVASGGTAYGAQNVIDLSLPPIDPLLPGVGTYYYPAGAAVIGTILGATASIVATSGSFKVSYTKSGGFGSGASVYCPVWGLYPTR